MIGTALLIFLILSSDCVVHDLDRLSLTCIRKRTASPSA